MCNILHLLRHLNGENQYIGTMGMIADATKIRIRTVQSTINELRDKNILRKIQNGVYMINPTMLMMGNVPKRRKSGSRGGTPGKYIERYMARDSIAEKS
jgi:DNA-binding transcriptional ArsR family regulator